MQPEWARQEAALGEPRDRKSVDAQGFPPENIVLCCQRVAGFWRDQFIGNKPATEIRISTPQM